MERKEAIKRTAAIMGGIIFAPNIFGVLNGCTPSKERWMPVLFSRKQADLTTSLAEVILPGSDTPGAIDAGVPGFIEKMVLEVYNQEQRDMFISGLDHFDDECRNNTGKYFSDLHSDAQLTYATEQNRLAIENEMHDGLQFFLIFKELTMVGFFTSEIGATQVLRHEHVPGYFDGCVPFEEIGRTWATG